MFDMDRLSKELLKFLILFKDGSFYNPADIKWSTRTRKMGAEIITRLLCVISILSSAVFYLFLSRICVCFKYCQLLVKCDGNSFTFLYFSTVLFPTSFWLLSVGKYYIMNNIVYGVSYNVTTVICLDFRS